MSKIKKFVFNVKIRLVGFCIILFFHLPKFFLWLLKKVYFDFFNTQSSLLTASPTEHLKRADHMLKWGNRSQLLYCALEIRFAIERMAQKELIFAEKSSNRMMDEYSPVKKVKNTTLLNPDSAFHHEIYMINPHTGERFKWGEYIPLDKKRVAAINGKLGDLLHPKEGLLLGIPNDPWYLSTKLFLRETIDYLSKICKESKGFFTYEGIKHFEMQKTDKEIKSD